MAKVDTLPELLRPLMDGPTVRAPFCVVCGRSYPLNEHHVVRRGAGRLYRHGIEVEKPTLTLCGSGNTSGCHGLAHAQRLHFRWAKDASRFNVSTPPGSGRWEYLLTDEPTKYQAALEMDGWRPIRTRWR